MFIYYLLIWVSESEASNTDKMQSVKTSSQYIL